MCIPFFKHVETNVKRKVGVQLTCTPRTLRLVIPKLL